jgi:eukaryotic-like serine/threonine-protein kinase
MSGIPAGAGSLLGKRLGKFEILALLALGGTAEIYLARIGGAAGFEKYVVVKCLHDHLADDAEFVKMFLDEARLAAHLDHSNVVQTMELGEHENRYYMVMEFLAGLSLAMIVRRAGERLPGGRIPIPLVLNMLAQASAGLHYAHEKAMNGKPLNIVHRDISPQNLVVSFEGVVKVVDFGIAKAELRETRTRSGTIKGKFAYMSPEQCVANNVDRRTDVFALGVIAHELLTGRRLFKKPSPYETYQAVIECKVDPPSKLNVEVDPALDPIIMRAVQKEKEARYPTAEAFGDAILGYLHHRGKGSGPGDVARFFDVSFAQEIEEHGARMRELISGEVDAVDSAKWNAEEEEARRNQTVDLGGRNSKDADSGDKSLSLDSIDILEPERGSLSEVIDDLGTGRGDEGDEMPAEKTRIETNPLERIDELNKVIVANKHKTPAPGLMATQIAPGSPPGPVTGALPLPPAPTGPISAAPESISPRVSSGRFPDLANLPTMIAESDDEDPETKSPALAKTEIEVQPYVDGYARTSMDMSPPAPSAINGAQQRPPMPSQPPPMRPAMPSQPPPMAYPVMNAQLSAQIATGASVFPSQTPSPARGSPSQPPPNLPMPDSGQHQQQYPRAMDLASPVGQHYPEHVDWAAAAAAPAKAIPPWKLIVIFLGVIGVATLLTILVASIFR